MCVCMCMCVHAHVSMFACLCACMYMCEHVCMPLCVCECVHGSDSVPAQPRPQQARSLPFPASETSDLEDKKPRAAETSHQVQPAHPLSEHRCTGGPDEMGQTWPRSAKVSSGPVRLMSKKKHCYFKLLHLGTCLLCSSS